MSIGFLKFFYFFEKEQNALSQGSPHAPVPTENFFPRGSRSFQLDRKYGTLTQVIKYDTNSKYSSVSGR